LQHEVDHLDGTLYIDRMLTRTFAAFAHVRDRFAGRPIAEIRAELGV
jgi:peptide deformylase